MADWGWSNGIKILDLVVPNPALSLMPDCPLRRDEAPARVIWMGV